MKQLFGHSLFVFVYAVLNSVRTRGLLRTLSYYPASFGLAALAYTWKARQFMHWALSRRVPQPLYKLRDAICRACEYTRVVDDGRYKDWKSRYCGICGCSQNRWSELTVKNRRKGHLCPAGKFPGQTPVQRKPGGCKGCGGNGADLSGKQAALQGLRGERNLVLPVGTRGRP